MNLLTQQSSSSEPSARIEVDRPSQAATREVHEDRKVIDANFDASIVSLKILAGALISRIESLRKSGDASELSLQREVSRFEAELIRMALIETGGRQRRAAKLLGMKATTLSTKIKRHRIALSTVSASDEISSSETDLTSPLS